MMADFLSGKIYIIKNSINDLVYIGSTRCELHERMLKHTHTLNHTSTKSDLPLYRAMAEHGQDNFYIELLEDYPCDTLTQLRLKEGEWITRCEANKPHRGYNIKVAGRTDTECKQIWNERNPNYKHDYYISNKNTINANNKLYYENNKDTILAHNKEYRQANKDLISRQRKEYVEANAEHVKEFKHDWYVKNKQRYAEDGKQVVMCECGCEVTKYNLTRHKKTKRHTDMIMCCVR